MSVNVRQPIAPVRWLMTLALVTLSLACLGTGRAQGQAADQTADRQAQRLLAARCSVCHSTDLIEQQRLPRDRWEATVSKMVHWGARLDEAEEAMLTAYLAKYLHSEAGPVAALPAASPSGREPGSMPTPGGVAARGAALYQQNCLACHGEAGRGGVGPKLAHNPILTEPARFRTTVNQGRGAMPPWASVLNGQDIADIHAWLTTLEDERP